MRRGMIEPGHPELCVGRQYKLLSTPTDPVQPMGSSTDPAVGALQRRVGDLRQNTSIFETMDNSSEFGGLVDCIPTTTHSTQRRFQSDGRDFREDGYVGIRPDLYTSKRSCYGGQFLPDQECRCKVLYAD